MKRIKPSLCSGIHWCILAVKLTLSFHVRDGNGLWPTVVSVKAPNDVFGIVVREERSGQNSLFPKEIEKQIKTVEFRILVILMMLIRVLYYIN